MQAAGVTKLETSLAGVRGGLGELDTSLEKSVPTLLSQCLSLTYHKTTIEDPNSISGSSKSRCQIGTPATSIRNSAQDLSFCDLNEKTGTPAG